MFDGFCDDAGSKAPVAPRAAPADLSFPHLLPTGHVSGVVVTVPEKIVNVATGGNATLLCTYTSSGALGNFFIQWSFYSAKESQLHTVRYLFIINMKLYLKYP